MDRSVCCIISGNKYIFAKDYFQKRVEEYGDAEALKKYYVTRKVKSLISRGYSVVEIRNILALNIPDLVDAESQEVKDVMEYHVLRRDTIKTNSFNFATHKSDPDVASFINNIKTFSL